MEYAKIKSTEYSSSVDFIFYAQEVQSMKKFSSKILLKQKELEFVVFCIENLAIRLKRDTIEIYELLTEKSNILDEYIIPNYEMLHTQDKEYILDDIITVIEEEGIEI